MLLGVVLLLVLVFWLMCSYVGVFRVCFSVFWLVWVICLLFGVWVSLCFSVCCV